MKNYRDKDMDFSNNFKISKEYKENREKNNYNNILEDDNRAKEFEKMLESINNNLKFRSEQKQEQSKKDRKLMRILNAETKRFLIDDLIEEDDIRLSKEELDFLNQIEYDTTEAMFYEKNLELIENINDPFKKKIVLDSISFLDENDKFIVFQRIESDFFYVLNQIDEHSKKSINQLVIEESIRKINYKKFMNIFNLIYKNYFELFYAISFSKLQNYFHSNIFLDSNKERISNLSKRSNYILENEEFFFDDKTIEKLDEFDDVERSVFFLSYVKKESYKIIRLLLDNYLNLIFEKKAAKIIKETNTSNQLFLTKKIELFRFISLLKLKWHEGYKKLSIFDQEKINSLPTDDMKMIEYKNNIKNKIINIINEIQNLQKKPSDFQKNSLLSFVDCNKFIVLYDDVNHILNNINLEISPQELVYINSDNEESKILLDIIKGNDNFLYGDLFIDGKNLAILNEKERKEIINNKIGEIKLFQLNENEQELSVENYIFLNVDNSLWTDDEIQEILNETSISSLMEFSLIYLEKIELFRVEIAKNIIEGKRIIIIRNINEKIEEYNYSFIERIMISTSSRYNITYIIEHNNTYELSENARKIKISNGKIDKDYKKENNDWI